MPFMKQRRPLFIPLLTMILAYLLIALTQKVYHPDETPSLMRSYTRSYGNENAPVHIVVFFDPVCAPCKQMRSHIASLMQRYPEKIKLSVRYAPFYTDSYYVVALLEAAGEKFEAVLNLLFEHQSTWVENERVYLERIWPLLETLELDIPRLKEAMKDERIDARIKQDLRDAKALGVNKTPYLFINQEALKESSLRAVEEKVVRLIQG